MNKKLKWILWFIIDVVGIIGILLFKIKCPDVAVYVFYLCACGLWGSLSMSIITLLEDKND